MKSFIKESIWERRERNYSTMLRNKDGALLRGANICAEFLGKSEDGNVSTERTIL